jgi:hypothetical protein
VAKKRRRKRSRLKTLLLFIATPLAVWLLAFGIWFYWNDLIRLTRKDRSQPPSKAVRHSGPPTENKPKEKILDEDRKKLEDILNKAP